MISFEERLREYDTYVKYWAIRVSRMTGIEFLDAQQELYLTLWKAFEKFDANLPENHYKALCTASIKYTGLRAICSENRKRKIKSAKVPVYFNSIKEYDPGFEDGLIARLLVDDIEKSLKGIKLEIYKYLKLGYKKYDISKLLDKHPQTIQNHIRKMAEGLAVMS